MSVAEVDAAEEPTTEEGRSGAATAGGRRRPPRAVWLATLVLASLGAVWTVAVPHYRAPDEAAHVDLVLYLADGHGYPRYDERMFGEEIGLDSDRYLIDLARPWPRFDADDAPARSDRPDVDDLGGVGPDAEARRIGDRRPGAPYVYNQMPQHPPLYYEAMAAVIGLERWVLPGDDPPSLDREVGLLRAVDVALLAALPLLAWATARRLGGSDRAGVVAALATLCLPQLVHIGAAVNNDNLFVLLGGVLAALLAGVARGQAGRRTDLAVGVVLGLALLTKAFAVMFVPWVAAAYAVAAVTTRSRRQAIMGGAVALGVGAVLGGWWWVGNWLREGQPAPTTESLTRTLADRPRGFSPDAGVFAWTFTGRLVTRTWAWVGFGKGKFDLPVAVVAVGTTAFLAATAVALVTARRGTAPGDGLRRVDVALAWLATILVAAFVARRAWGLYVTTGRFAFVQGRYLFGTIVGPMAVAAIGAARVHRRAPVAVVAGAIVVQGWVLRDVIAGAWSGDGRAGAIDGMLAWSPWPAAAVAAVAVVGGAALVALVVECWRVSAAGQPSPTNPSGGPIGLSSAGAGTMRKMR